MDNKIILPQELQYKQVAEVIVITGKAGSGKTTLACTANNAVLMDFEGGSQRAGALTSIFVPTTFRECVDIVGDVVNQGYKTVVLDTALGLITYCITEIRQQPKCCQRDGITPTQLCWGRVKQAIISLVTLFVSKGVSVVILAHLKEGENRELIPDSPGRALDEIIKMCNYIGRLYSENDERLISFKNDELFPVGKGVGENGKVYPIPNLSNDPFFFADLLNELHSENKKQYDTVIDVKRKLTPLIEQIRQADTIDSANALIVEFSKIGNVGLKKSANWILWTKALKNGWTFSKDKGCFTGE